jgi:ribA/ribD-fused uncharacterized protein
VTIDFYTLPFYALNNFSAHAIEFNGKLYPTAEHAYQATKCTDEKGKEAIRRARSPMLAKELSHGLYHPARDPEWESKKVAIMEDIFRAKLAQHDEVLTVLKQSGTDEIIEGSPVDFFWGTGKDGSGENQLGKLWMKIRAEL